MNASKVPVSEASADGLYARASGERLMLRALFALLLFPSLGAAWTLNDRCELTRETPKGTVSVARTPNGILLYLPDGLVADDARVKVDVGSRTWRGQQVGGAVELQGGAEPFLAKNWMSVYAGGDHVLGFSLLGTSAAWTGLDHCVPAGDGGNWIALAGEITQTTDDGIIAAIRRQRPEGLLLNSTGGLAVEAQRIGHAVRAAGMVAKVEAGGQCLSECTFILAAGISRSVEAGARVGLRPALVTKGLGVWVGNRRSVAETAAYFDAMGVNGGKVAVLATSSASSGERIFSATELRDTGLVTTGRPSAIMRSTEEAVSQPDAVDWWWLLGLLGLVGAFWGVTTLWRGMQRMDGRSGG